MKIPSLLDSYVRFSSDQSTTTSKKILNIEKNNNKDPTKVLRLHYAKPL